MDRAEYEARLLSGVIDSIQRNGGAGRLCSIILTGSFGRQEQTYTVAPDGTFALKSDVEIALIYSGSRQKKQVELLARRVAEEFSEDLNLMPISRRRLRYCHNFNAAICTPRKKTLFTYDLFNGSRTIWGEDIIAQRRVSLDEVDLYEAKRLIANRIGELVCMEQTGDADSRVQWKGKVLLAIGSAWLLGKGQYTSSCAAQCERLKLLRQELEQDMGEGFYQEYEQVFRYLRRSETAYEVPDVRLREYAKRADALLKRMGLRRPRVNSLSRVAKYCIKYVKTGLKFGLFGFEDRILQELILDYYTGASALEQAARVWKRVLY